MRGLLTRIRERRSYVFTDDTPTAVMPTMYDQTNEVEIGITRIETGGNWLGELAERFPTPWTDPTIEHDRTVFGDLPTGDDWPAVGEPTVQLRVQRKYDGPTCNDCGTPSLVTPCVACSTRSTT